MKYILIAAILLTGSVNANPERHNQQVEVACKDMLGTIRWRKGNCYFGEEVVGIR